MTDDAALTIEDEAPAQLGPERFQAGVKRYASKDHRVGRAVARLVVGPAVLSGVIALVVLGTATERLFDERRDRGHLVGSQDALEAAHRGPRPSLHHGPHDPSLVQEWRGGEIARWGLQVTGRDGAGVA